MLRKTIYSGTMVYSFVYSFICICSCFDDVVYYLRIHNIPKRMIKMNPPQASIILPGANGVSIIKNDIATNDMNAISIPNCDVYVANSLNKQIPIPPKTTQNRNNNVNILMTADKIACVLCFLCQYVLLVIVL